MSMQDLMTTRHDNVISHKIFKERQKMNGSITSRYNFGKMDETILRIERELDDLCKEIKLITETLENCNGK